MRNPVILDRMTKVSTFIIWAKFEEIKKNFEENKSKIIYGLDLFNLKICNKGVFKNILVVSNQIRCIYVYQWIKSLHKNVNFAHILIRNSFVLHEIKLQVKSEKFFFQNTQLSKGCDVSPQKWFTPSCMDGRTR